MTSPFQRPAPSGDQHQQQNASASADQPASSSQQAPAAARSGPMSPSRGQKPAVQPCRYKTGKTLGAGSYSVVKECVHIDSGRYYAAKVINKRMMAGREHMVSLFFEVLESEGGVGSELRRVGRG